MKSFYSTILLVLCCAIAQAVIEKCDDTASRGRMGGKSCIDGTNSVEGLGPLNVCLQKKLHISLDDVKERETTKQLVAGMKYVSKFTTYEGMECTVTVESQVWMQTMMCNLTCPNANLYTGDKINIYDEYMEVQNTREMAKKSKLKVTKDEMEPLLLGAPGGLMIRDVPIRMVGESSSRPKRAIVERKDDVLSMDRSGEIDEDVKNIFNEFIMAYNRTYREYDNSDVYGEKLQVFAKNLGIVQQLNKEEKGSAIYGITKFMDYSEEEYKRYLAPGLKESVVSIPEAELSALNLNDVPDNVDWREKGAVTDVKNQGMCGSCWAFSTTGNIEGQYAIKHGELLSLSEQELVDCDDLDDGCEGGLPSNAYKSIEKLGGLEGETDYPYDGKDDTCNIDKSDIKVTVSGGVQLPEDEALLAAWIAQNGPVSIGINANLMQFYWGGVSHPWKIFCNPKKLDHGVLIVGYGTDEEKGTPYWLIKNSWGPDWGEDGYYRIYRGDGSCGVNLMATSAVVD